MANSPAEAAEVSELILSMFAEFVAPDYTETGIAEIRRYVMPQELQQRATEDCFVLVAATDSTVVGMIEVQAADHITLLFVDKAHHGQGIARALVESATERCGTPLTVHASRYAVPFYQRLGFLLAGPERSENGRVFQPMVLE